VKQVVIENPVINSPFREPGRHFKFTDEGITNEVLDGRRTSSYFVPIAQPRKKGQKQLVFDTEWTKDRIEENKLVNQTLARVTVSRKGTCWPTGLVPRGSYSCESATRNAAPRTAPSTMVRVSLSATTDAPPGARTSEAWRVVGKRGVMLARGAHGAC
jgi:hypothetical protein